MVLIVTRKRGAELKVISHQIIYHPYDGMWIEINIESSVRLNKKFDFITVRCNWGCVYMHFEYFSVTSIMIIMMARSCLCLNVKLMLSCLFISDCGTYTHSTMPFYVHLHHTWTYLNEIAATFSAYIITSIGIYIVYLDCYLLSDIDNCIAWMQSRRKYHRTYYDVCVTTAISGAYHYVRTS